MCTWFLNNLWYNEMPYLSFSRSSQNSSPSSHLKADKYEIHIFNLYSIKYLMFCW